MGKALLEMDEPVDRKVYPTWEAAVERLVNLRMYCTCTCHSDILKVAHSSL